MTTVPVCWRFGTQFEAAFLDRGSQCFLEGFLHLVHRDPVLGTFGSSQGRHDLAQVKFEPVAVFRFGDVFFVEQSLRAQVCLRPLNDFFRPAGQAHIAQRLFVDR